MQNIVIFGHTDFSELVGWYVEHEERYRLLGYTVNEKYLDNGQLSNSGGVLPYEHLRERLAGKDFQILLTIGYRQMNAPRRAMAARLKADGYTLASFISRESRVDAECIGEGTIVLPGCVIQPFVHLGDGNLFEAGVTICHHTQVGDYNFFAPSVAVAGQVQIGDECFLGNNCTVKNGVQIGDRVLVGAGAYVAHDVDAGKVIVPERSVELERSSKDMKI